MSSFSKSFFSGTPGGTLECSTPSSGLGTCSRLRCAHRWVSGGTGGEGSHAISPGHTYSFFCTSATLKPLRCTGAMQRVNWPTVRRCRSQSESQARWQSQYRWLECRRLGAGKRGEAVTAGSGEAATGRTQCRLHAPLPSMTILGIPGGNCPLHCELPRDPQPSYC